MTRMRVPAPVGSFWFAVCVVLPAQEFVHVSRELLAIDAAREGAVIYREQVSEGKTWSSQ